MALPNGERVIETIACSRIGSKGTTFSFVPPSLFAAAQLAF
jgi:hypothetical protein